MEDVPAASLTAMTTTADMTTTTPASQSIKQEPKGVPTVKRESDAGGGGPDGDSKKPRGSRLFYLKGNCHSSGVAFRVESAKLQQLGMYYNPQVLRPFSHGKIQTHTSDDDDDYGLFATSASIHRMLSKSNRHRAIDLHKSTNNTTPKPVLMDVLVDEATLTVRIPRFKLLSSSRSRTQEPNPDGGWTTPPPRESLKLSRGEHLRTSQGLFGSPSTKPKLKTLANPVVAGVTEPVPETVKERVTWTPGEDELLNAAVTDFGQNWQLVCNILSNHTRVSGRLRSMRHCMQRWMALNAPPPDSPTKKKLDGKNVKLEPAFPALPPPAVPPDKGEKKTNKGGRKKIVAGGTKSESAPFAATTDRTDVITPGSFGDERVWGLVDKGMKVVQSKEKEPNKLGKDVETSILLQTIHVSHKKTITDVHTRSGLPSALLGKALMPHQIVQLRTRRLNQARANEEKQRQAAAAAASTAQQPPAPPPAQPKHQPPPQPRSRSTIAQYEEPEHQPHQPTPQPHPAHTPHPQHPQIAPTPPPPQPTIQYHHHLTPANSQGVKFRVHL